MAIVLTPHETECVKTTQVICVHVKKAGLKKEIARAVAECHLGGTSTQTPTLPQLHFQLCNMFPKDSCLFPSLHRGLICIAENISWANNQKFLQPTLVLKLSQRHNGI